MNFFSLFIFIIFTTVYSTSIHKIQSRIFNGKPAKRKDFPYQAGIFVHKYQNETYGRRCSGALISNYHVLTAAHCFYNKSTQEFLPFAIVLLGGIRNFDPNESDIEVRYVGQKNIYVHDGYMLGAGNDIAVIKLRRSVTLKANIIEPIKLPRRNQGDLFGKIAKVAGWGNTVDHIGGGSDILRYTTMTIVQDSECYVYVTYTPIVKICVRSEKSNTCQGDSGSPFVIIDNSGIKNVVGILSGGEKFCEDLGPTTVTNVHYHLDWISSVTSIPINN